MNAVPPLVAAAVARGWSVIPVGLDKRPLVSWKPWQSRRPTIDEVEGWQVEYDPPAWAVITGAVSRVVVLDFDGQEGARLLKELGLTPHVRTGSGGYHVYVKHPGVRVKTATWKADKLVATRYAGLDVRGDGGYAVFVGRNELGEYRHLVDHIEPYLPESLPEDLGHAIGLAPSPSGESLSRTGTPFTTGAGDPQVCGDVLVTRALERAQTEGRNNAGFWLACQLRDNGYAHSSATKALMDYARRVHPTNQHGEREPYTESEVVAAVRSAYGQPARAAWGGEHTRSADAENRTGGARDASLSQGNSFGGVLEDIDLFRTPTGEAYATVPVSAHAETYPVRSQRFRDWVLWRFLELQGSSPDERTVAAILRTASGLATFSAVTCPVHVRVAGDLQRICLDLGEDEHGVIEVTPGGWRLETHRDVRFVRPAGMAPLPRPERGGSVSQLRRCANVGSDEDFVLLVGWLLAAFCPRGPYPILVLHGPQGSGKTTLARMLRALVDPGAGGLRDLPQDHGDLLLAARNSWLIALDNLSDVPRRHSDSLCQIAGGISHGERRLRTNTEEVVFGAARPIVVNGIGPWRARPDFSSRSIVLHLPPIPGDKRRDEKSLWDEFDELSPAIFGAILDALSMALRNLPEVRVERPPRLADFARWVTAAEPVLGWPAGTFVRAYAGQQNTPDQQAGGVSPIREHVTALARKGWDGTATELFRDLISHASAAEAKSPRWPTAPTRLSRALRRIVPDLARAGVTVDFPRTSHSRMIRLRSAGDAGDAPDDAEAGSA